ncbi:hypothetical protein NQZ68_031365 [Dissostichus eleginoides]|nr:hypothetical protein NQZ68_031365 [Dissostichus eleginoides]
MKGEEWVSLKCRGMGLFEKWREYKSNMKRGMKDVVGTLIRYHLSLSVSASSAHRDEKELEAERRRNAQREEIKGCLGNTNCYLAGHYDNSDRNPLFARASGGDTVFCFCERVKRETDRELQENHKPQKLSFDSAHLGPFRGNTLAREREKRGGEERKYMSPRVPIEWPAMTVPPENAGYASGVALMEPERGCSCLPRRRDIVQLDKAA